LVIDAEFQCAYCGETCYTTVDPSGGRNQQYTEDCHVCCRPNILYCSLEDEDGSVIALIDTEQEYEA